MPNRYIGKSFDRCCEIFKTQSGTDLREIIFATTDAEEAARQLQATALAQPAIFATEYALARLWMSWGIEPKGMLGHSIGEFVAACLAGVFSLEDAVRLVGTRGRLMQDLPGGAMLSVRLPEAEVRPLHERRALDRRTECAHADGGFGSACSSRRAGEHAEGTRCDVAALAYVACVSFLDDGSDSRAVHRRGPESEAERASDSLSLVRHGNVDYARAGDGSGILGFAFPASSAVFKCGAGTAGSG